MAWLKLKTNSAGRDMLINSDHIVRFTGLTEKSSKLHLSEIGKNGEGESVVVELSIEDLKAVLGLSELKVVDV